MSNKSAFCLAHSQLHSGVIIEHLTDSHSQFNQSFLLTHAKALLLEGTLCQLSGFYSDSRSCFIHTIRFKWEHLGSSFPVWKAFMVDIGAANFQSFTISISQVVLDVGYIFLNDGPIMFEKLCNVELWRFSQKTKAKSYSNTVSS